MQQIKMEKQECQGDCLAAQPSYQLMPMFTNRDVEDLIKDIRAEAATQKECITRYTFQALIVTGVLWTLAFKFDSKDHGLVFSACGMLCCILVGWVMFIVSRMANHKYHTVNRNLGYELHLYRLKDYFLKERSEQNKKRAEEWSAKMLEIGWEEAMCSARVVQATLYNHLYEDCGIRLPKWAPYQGILDHHWLWPHRLKKEHAPRTYSDAQLKGKKIYTWYDTRRLIGSEYDYHPGSYLRNIHVTLHAVGVVSVLMSWGFYSWACVIAQPDPLHVFSLHHLLTMKGCFFTLGGMFNLLFSIFFFTQVNRQTSFRQILQSGILSIQSSAVVWRIVSTCHILGKECAFYKTNSYMSYTRYTYGLALEARKNFYRIHQWLAELEECHEDQQRMQSKFDELFPNEKEPQYLEYLPGHELNIEPDCKLDKWP